MRRNWDDFEDEALRQSVQEGMQGISWTRQQEEDRLQEIHRAMEERSRTMKLRGKKMVLAVAAALAVTGSITAVAAGKITGYYSSTNLDEAIDSPEELQAQGRKQLGNSLIVAGQLGDGSAFNRGFIHDVEGRDETGAVMLTYPTVWMDYGEVSVDVMRVQDVQEEGGKEPDYQETYQGVLLEGTADPYLFLPPDEKPTAEEEALEAAGELYISYGSSQREEMVYKGISWEKDGLHYLMMTSGDRSLEELAGLAKGYLDLAE